MRLLLILGLTLLIVCGAFADSAIDADAPVQLKRPIQTSLRIDGRRTPLRGEITAWSYGAFWVVRKGGSTPTRFAWDELQPAKVYEIARRMIDRKDAGGNLRLGIEMLRLGEIKAARRAFRVAEQADPELEAVIKRAIDFSIEGKDPALALVEETPDPSSPAGSHEAATAAMLTLGHNRVDSMGGDFEHLETEHFIVFVQRGEISVEAFAQTLERIHDEYAKALGIGEEGSFFEGKSVCYLVTDQVAYRKLASLLGEYQTGSDDAEDRSFFARRDVGKCVELGFQYTNDLGEMAQTWEYLMYRDIALAIMDHFHSDRRLPFWVETGLLRHVRLLIHPDGYSVNKQVKAATEYSKYNSVAVFIRRSKDKFDSMGNDSIIVSHFLVRSLILQKPEEFADWLGRIKNGEDWEFALQEAMGFDVDSLGIWFEKQLGVAPR